MDRSSICHLLDTLCIPALVMRHSKPSGIIFMLHSVSEAVQNEFCPNALWRVTPENFRMLINVAEEMGFHAVSISEAVNRIKSDLGEQPPFYAITFDDGYADNLHVVLPLAHELNVPITVYVTSGFVERSHHAWWHILERVIRQNQRVNLRIGESTMNARCTTPLEKQILYTKSANVLRQATPENLAIFVEAVIETYGNQVVEETDALFLNKNELVELAQKPGVTIGTHGHSHVSLAYITSRQLHQEIQSCARFLSAIIGITPIHHAYPFGGIDDAKQREFDSFQESTIESAVTTQHGIFLRGQKYNNYSLPRIPLFPYDTDYTLRCKLSGLSSVLFKAKQVLSNRGKYIG